MDEATLRLLLDDVRSGAVSPDDAVSRLRRLPFADLGFARVDHHRELRQGMPEAVYGPGKTPEQCAAIVAELLAEGSGPVLLTRASDDQAWVSLRTNPGAAQRARTLVWRPAAARPGDILVLTAGTADLPVADECLAFAMRAGLDPERVLDVISKGAAQSWQMENRGKTMIAGKFDFGFAVDWMRKDLAICLTEARSNGARLPVTAIVDQFYAQVQARGGARWDTSSLIRLLNDPK